jgi:hypothetical protein
MLQCPLNLLLFLGLLLGHRFLAAWEQRSSVVERVGTRRDAPLVVLVAVLGACSSRRPPGIAA